MVELEGGAGCVLYPCGAAAVANAILSFVGAGDHLLVTGSAYEPTQDFCTHILGRMNVSTTYFDPLIGADIATLIQPNTRVVFLESPGSITLEVQDIPAMVQAIRAVAPEVVIMIDNTWGGGRAVQGVGFRHRYLHSGRHQIPDRPFRLHARHRRRQRALLGATARVLLSDGADGGCRHRLHGEPRPAYPERAPEAARTQQH
ncbi:Cystathionine beta-lyase metC [Serratia marcescens]|uniref:Cystathionine beta-lyase metC n=1 Tax=Serratia marcescens TaxID=615 RepID=A0A379YKJ5_SERMA|nr:Cystathionine beta-lyase metC [Serratia marcescens]